MPSMDSSTLRAELGYGHRVALIDMITSLRRALVTPPADPGWRERLADRLGVLRRSFAEHVQATEGRGGLYAEILDEAPRLAAGIRLLEREHAGLTHSIEIVHRRAASAARDELRCWSGELLAALLAHRQRGADLVYEAYATDIGGET